MFGRFLRTLEPGKTTLPSLDLSDHLVLKEAVERLGRKSGRFFPSLLEWIMTITAGNPFPTLTRGRTNLTKWIETLFLLLAGNSTSYLQSSMDNFIALDPQVTSRIEWNYLTVIPWPKNKGVGVYWLMRFFSTSWCALCWRVGRSKGKGWILSESPVMLAPWPRWRTVVTQWIVSSLPRLCPLFMSEDLGAKHPLYIYIQFDQLLFVKLARHALQ